MQHKDGPELVIVPVEDSPDARLFIDLSSHTADLTEALHALDLAISSRDHDSSLAEARVFLVGYAVGSYCRTILASNVRNRLTDYVDIPADLRTTHETRRLPQSNHRPLTVRPVGDVPARSR